MACRLLIQAMRLLGILAISAVFGIAHATGPIRVQDGDWGGASARDVEAVLRSVVEVLPDLAGDYAPRIVVSPAASGPRVLARKSADGAHQVLLSVRGPRWDQLAYQFSHELCHVASNYDRRPIDASRAHQWFEEAVCEAVAIVALQRLAVRWETAPPHASWSSYAPAFRAYAERLLKAEHRHAAPAGGFADWYRRNAPALARDPYLREKNEVAATALVAAFSGAGLHVMRYLNLEPPAHEGFAAYLAAWLDCCPPEHRPVVRRALELFGA